MHINEKIPVVVLSWMSVRFNGAVPNWVPLRQFVSEQQVTSDPPRPLHRVERLNKHWFCLSGKGVLFLKDRGPSCIYVG